MNAPRKKQVVALPDSHEFSGWFGLIKKHANTALTVLLLIAAVVMFIRWRMKSAEVARQSVALELSNASGFVEQLRQMRIPGRDVAELVKGIQMVQNNANSAISNVLNSPDADAAMRAQTLVLRGDLYWELANLPPLPGSATQPSFSLSETSDALLQKSWDAYQEVVKNSTYAGQHQQLDASHMGLAAIAENRNDWATARKELEMVQNDSGGLPVMVDAATRQLEQLPELQKKIYIAPPSGIAQAGVPQATLTPAGPPAPSLSPSVQFKLPGVISPVVPAMTPVTTKP